MTTLQEGIAQIPRRNVGPINFSVMPLVDAVNLVTNLGSQSLDKGVAVHFCNAYNVALADDDSAYAEIINSGDLVFTDGTPVVWAGQRLHKELAPSWTRVYGPDMLTGVLAQANASTEPAPRHYFLGSTPETIAALRNAIQTNWPTATIAGMESPPFRPPTEAELAERDERIRESGATCIWVGLGTPKQDFEVHRVAEALPVVALAVGAAFDFIARTKRQAPEWMQDTGTEWCYRLATEPRRLGRRYFWGNPRFVAVVCRQLLRRSECSVRPTSPLDGDL